MIPPTRGVGWRRDARRRRVAPLPAAAAILLVGLVVPPPLHTQESPFTWAANATLVGQAASDERLRSEAVGSLDVFLDLTLGGPRLHVLLEGNTTPRSGGVWAHLPLANADAGTALDGSGRGRVQISELRLVWPLGSAGQLHTGLLDVTGFLDVSRISNDENLFFLGIPFVNNPTIEFPDYAPGAVAEGWVPGFDDLRLAVAATSSNGVADNPSAGYGDLLDVDAPGKGVFAGARLRWEGTRSHASLGGWVNTRDHTPLDGSGPPEASHGVYAVGGVDFARHALDLRVGVADGRVSPLRRFVGATYLLAGSNDALGLAVGRSSPSERMAEAVATTQAELFYRRRVLGAIYMTASLQHILNPGHDGSGGAVDDRVWVAGIRLSTALPGG